MKKIMVAGSLLIEAALIDLQNGISLNGCSNEIEQLREASQYKRLMFILSITLAVLVVLDVYLINSVYVTTALLCVIVGLINRKDIAILLTKEHPDNKGRFK